MLPSPLWSASTYFQECMNFLKKYSWIYQSSNTRFIKDGVLDKFPDDWIEYFTNIETDDLNRFPLLDPLLIDSITSMELASFSRNLSKLTPSGNTEPDDKTSYGVNDVSVKLLKKVNRKKQHEISRLSQLIIDLCHKDDILIDFGSGLGYLSEMIFHSDSSFRILGLESDQCRIETSRIRIENSMPPLASDMIKYERHKITESSGEYIKSSIQSLFPHSPDRKLSLSIVGLHSCADLTVTSMKLFSELDTVQKLIIMPCCYHKMEMEIEQSSSQSSVFRNFPLSRNLLELSEPAQTFFNRPFLRLACQETVSRWQTSTKSDHEKHGKEMFLRGVAENILDDNEIIVKQKNVKINSSSDPLTFIDLSLLYAVKCAQSKNIKPWTKSHEIRFNETLRKYQQGPKLAEALTCLQTAMQRLCENIVLFDRLCFMNEMAEERGQQISVRYRKIMNENLSPRCYVMIAEKL